MMESSDVQQPFPSPRKTVSSRYVTIPVFLLLVISVTWLYIEVGRLRVSAASLGIVTLASRVDENASTLSSVSSRVATNRFNISSLDSELSYVASIAENANMWAHSHSYSDARLKTNVSNIPFPLTTLLKLNGITFNWIQDEDHYLSDDPQIGLIAQEVEMVFPELVYEGPDGYKQVDYVKLTPILIEAVREQQEQIGALQVQNADLEARLALIESIFPEISGTSP